MLPQRSIRKRDKMQGTTVKRITIDGSNIHDIPSFYDEINRIFMADEDWKLGPGLDALNDMLSGGYGLINGNEKIDLVWKDFDRNRQDLGLELTKKFYEDKLKSPNVYSADFVHRKLSELGNGTGQTYFEIILEIINDHPNIHLIPG